MKRKYEAPDFETHRLKLSPDILGDSKWENPDSEIVDSQPNNDDIFD